MAGQLGRKIMKFESLAVACRTDNLTKPVGHRQAVCGTFLATREAVSFGKFGVDHGWILLWIDLKNWPQATLGCKELKKCVAWNRRGNRLIGSPRVQPFRQIAVSVFRCGHHLDRRLVQHLAQLARVVGIEGFSRAAKKLTADKDLRDGR